MALSRFSVVGLGKLGAPIAACIASKGYQVIGVDVSPEAIERVNRGQAPVFEPGLDDLLTASRSRLSATSDYEQAVLGSDITFVVVPTPSDDHGGFSLRHVAAAAREIGRALSRKDDYHIVVITSTVLPGSTQYGILPILEQASGKVCGRDFGLSYGPEFIALGTVIHDFLNPDFVLIGESDPRTGEELEAFYKAVCENDPPVARMSFVNAELTKIAVNTYVTTKIAFANMLGEICEQLPGADVDTVTKALGLDSRIGPRYLKAGLGYGGPCFPRDNLALGYLARSVDSQALLAESTDQANRSQAERLVDLVQAHSRPGGRIAVLGLAYKPGSNVVEESQALYLARRLADLGFRVVAFDPLALEGARREMGDRISYARSVKECVALADTVVLANPDPAFASLRREDLRQGEPVVFVDAWRLLRQRLQGVEGVDYVGLGVGDHSSALASRLAALWSEEAASVE